MPLVFPGSSRKKADPPPDPFELAFRDGKRSVAPYIADLMSGIDTVRYTYEEAVAEMNGKLVRDHANGALAKVLRRGGE